MKAWLDQHLNHFVSKKLLVFSVATVAFFMGSLPSESWVQLAMAYIGSQAAVDIVAKLRK